MILVGNIMFVTIGMIENQNLAGLIILPLRIHKANDWRSSFHIAFVAFDIQRRYFLGLNCGLPLPSRL